MKFESIQFRASTPVPVKQQVCHSPKWKEVSTLWTSIKGKSHFFTNCLYKCYRGSKYLCYYCWINITDLGFFYALCSSMFHKAALCIFTFLKSGLMGISTPPTVQQSSNRDTAIPGICKELIGQSVSRLRNSSGTEESLADRLISDLSLIYKTVQTISDLYNGLDDDSQDNGKFQKQKRTAYFLTVWFDVIVIIAVLFLLFYFFCSVRL